MYVTDFGQEIAAAAEKILDEVQAIDARMMAHKGQLTGRIKLSVVSTGKYVMPYFLSDFLKKNEGVELMLDVTNKAKVVESMSRNEVDFALVSVLPESMNVNSLKLMQNKLFLVANTENKYGPQVLGNTIFESLPLIFREQGSGTRYVIEKFIEKNKLKVKKKMELTSNEAVKQAVIAGLGASIMPLIGLRNELTNGVLQIIPVKKFPIRSTWQLIWMKNKKFSPASQAFLDHLIKCKDKIIQDKFDWYEKY